MPSGHIEHTRAVARCFAALGLRCPDKRQLIGSAEAVGEHIILPLLAALGYRVPGDIWRRPQLSHPLVSVRCIPDYGVYAYQAVPQQAAPRLLCGLVIAVQNYDKNLGIPMLEKLAGCCALAGAAYGLLCNGRELVVIRPTPGVVSWDYCPEVPPRAALQAELAQEMPTYTESGIIYAGRIIRGLSEADVAALAGRFHSIIRSRKGLAVSDRLYEFSRLLVVRIVDELRYKQGKQSELYLSARALDALLAAGGSVAQHINRRLAAACQETGIFAVDAAIDLPDNLLEQAIREFDPFALWSRRFDILGSVYERFLQHSMTGQEMGQYFTPRPLVEGLVQMLDPRPGQRILDPSCGSGGFLIYALLYLSEQNEQREQDKQDSHMYGIDVFAQAATLCRVNLWLHGEQQPHIACADSLSAEEAPPFLLEALRSPAQAGFDIIVTNPPFGAREGTRLRKQDAQRLAAGWQQAGINLFECALPGRDMQPQSPCIELCIKALKQPQQPGQGGRLGIVIDNGILSNISREEPALRAIIQRECIIEAVVGLPKGSFKPYGSNVIPVFLLLRRRLPDEQQGPIFRAEAAHIGFGPGYTRYRETTHNDLPAIVQYWQHWQHWQQTQPTQPTQAVTVLDERLPVWTSQGQAERLDNAYWSPASVQAAAELERLAQAGRVQRCLLGDLLAPGSPAVGITPTGEGRLAVLEGHNLRPNYVVPVFSKFATHAAPDLRPDDLLLSKDGEPGSFAVVTEELLAYRAEIVPGSHIYRIRLAEPYREHACFIALLLNSRLGQALVRRFIAGGTTPTLRSQDVARIPLCLPTAALAHESRRARERIRQLQARVIETVSSLDASASLLQALGAQEPGARLPINWAGGGRSDPHGYDRESS